MDTESKVAIGLFAGGLAGLGMYGASSYGIASGAVFVVIMLVVLSLQVALGLAACLLIAHIMGSSFGLIGHAIIKLAGIISATWALSLLLPSGFGIITLVIYFGLLYYLFELEWAEVIGFAVTLWILRFLAGLFIGQLLHAALGG